MVFAIRLRSGPRKGRRRVAPGRRPGDGVCDSPQIRAPEGAQACSPGSETRGSRSRRPLAPRQGRGRGFDTGLCTRGCTPAPLAGRIAEGGPGIPGSPTRGYMPAPLRGAIRQPNTSTGLMWEKKTDDGTIHDKDNVYTWSTGSPYNPDGTTFFTFLATLNHPRRVSAAAIRERLSSPRSGPDARRRDRAPRWGPSPGRRPRRGSARTRSASAGSG